MRGDAAVQEATTVAVAGEDAERAGDKERARALYRRAATLYAFLARTRCEMRSENAVSAVSLALRAGDVDAAGSLLAEFWDAQSDLFLPGAWREFQQIGRVLRRPTGQDHVEEGHAYWWRAEGDLRAGHDISAREKLRVAALHYAVAFLAEAPAPTCETSSFAASAVLAAHRAGDARLARDLAAKARRALPDLAPLAREEIDAVLAELPPEASS